MELKKFEPYRYANNGVECSLTIKKLNLPDPQKRQIAKDIERQIEWACEDYLGTIINNIALKKELKAPLRLRDYKAMLAQATEALEKLKEFRPEAGPGILRACKGFTEGDADAPFFTETFLYLTIGKEDARTLLGRMRTLAEAVGGVARHETGF